MRMKVCPNCNSTNIAMDTSVWSDNVYYCKKCKFRSKLFTEIEVDPKKLKLKPLNKAKTKKSRV